MTKLDWNFPNMPWRRLWLLSPSLEHSRRWAPPLATKLTSWVPISAPENKDVKESAAGLIPNFWTCGGKDMITKFMLDETGLELSEYAVAAALVAVAVAGVFAALGNAIVGKISELTGQIGRASCRERV